MQQPLPKAAAVKTEALPTRNAAARSQDDMPGLTRVLIREARDGTLAVDRAADGHPAASRVLVASDFRGHPILLVSDLSSHTQVLRSDARCSLLVGRHGKGDPLAHPRATLIATARFVERTGSDHQTLRERFLSRHPKSKLYVDLGDFAFVRLDILEAFLVAGFGRASTVCVADLIDEPAEDLEASEGRARTHMNDDHADAIAKLAARAGLGDADWRIASMDRRGFEVASGDRLHRIDFPEDAAKLGYRQAFVSMVR